ncbi:hypothetical protein DFH09DRAFT_1100427 [Mycena vulgaris]|nr:hypothetical protein DFH09DRAFT_1100427 [Mycena vulgaris]
MLISMVLVLFGGVFAGCVCSYVLFEPAPLIPFLCSRLTLGLMRLDKQHLRVLAMSSEDPNKQKNAKKVLDLMEKGRHWVLVIGASFAVVALSTTAICEHTNYDGARSR